MIRTIIIDDHPHAIASLEAELAAVSVDVEVIASATSPSEGFRLINEMLPDLVLMDIDMPGMTGFDLLAHFPNPAFKVIMVTAFEDFAIKAFKANALDYLLKPVDRDDLIRALNKYRQSSRESNVKQDGSQHAFSRLAIPYNGSVIFLNTADVLYCAAEGSYSKIVAMGKSYVISRNLKETETYLPSFFCRIHHSHTVNLNHVVKYTRGEGGYVTLSDGTTLSVARNRKDTLLSRLEIR
ncbi:MAG: response regulator transcription factor [Bacteroidales bacterium]|nr:response regulator transcription factor [Bacteroidales bacterium]